MYWLTIFFINWFLNILAIEFLAIRKMKRIIQVDENRDSKFKAFRRLDVQWLNRPWLFLTCHLCIIKIFVAFFSLCICGITSQIMVIGLKKEDSITGIRYFVMRSANWITSTIVLFAGCSNVWISKKRSNICYKKYLGPDWKPDFNPRHAGCVVANHSGQLDIASNCLQQIASFVAKEEAAKVPFVGLTIAASQCLLLNRTSRESKNLIQEQITQRIKLGEETGDYDPIVIFPEGGTTNGRYLINFKRGAFYGLRGVFPKVHKHHSYFQQPSSGILDGLQSYLIGSAIPFSTLEIIHMPIFKPNAYFFKHHKQEGEEDY